MATNICFDCINSVPDSDGHGCPWSERFEPVPGWTAKPSSLAHSAAGWYEVSKCPMFERDRPPGPRAAPGVKVRCVETGVVYPSLTAAACAVYGCRYTLRDAIKQGKSYRGYRWELE